METEGQGRSADFTPVRIEAEHGAGALVDAVVAGHDGAALIAVWPMSEGKQAELLPAAVRRRRSAASRKDPPEPSATPPKRRSRRRTCPQAQPPVEGPARARAEARGRLASAPAKTPPRPPAPRRRRRGRILGRPRRQPNEPSRKRGQRRRPGPQSPRPPLEPKRSWFAQLRHGLARTSTALSDNLASVLTKRKLDEETLDRLEEVLIKADLGVAMAARIRCGNRQGPLRAGARPGRGARGRGRRDRRRARAGGEHFALARRAPPACVPGGRGERHRQDHHRRPRWPISSSARGLSVMLAAADTFRAAAIDQLKVWGDARRRGGRRQGGRRRPGRRRLRGARTRPRRKASTCC